MTEEEKESIEQLKSWREYIIKHKETVNKANDIEFYLRTALNLIQKQDTEINSLKETIQKQEKSREHLKKQLKGEIAVKDTEINKLKQENKNLKIIENKLMPLAECGYWNYENHTCTHTCRECDELSETNRRCSSGILIDKDRYCRLYEDGFAEKDTKYVNVEDLINRHINKCGKKG